MPPERLPAPRRGEWRSVVREPEQSFEDYVRDCANRKSSIQSELVILPLGGVSFRWGPMLELLREYGAMFFGVEARVATDRELPDRAHVSPRDQHNSSMILDELAAHVTDPALITVAITDADLFSRGKKYVFGEGNLERRVGICSLARLRSSDELLVRRRALRLMSHEAGHILSITHCLRSRCLMQGANTLEEADRHPLEPCPEDLRKIQWNTGVNLVQRGAKLRVFHDRMGWSGESGFQNAVLR
ncbi:MAG TPA: archaemetzincin [Planctomycetota bacterium]|nr:archaemetzincin [Planctomycetota bacterium]